MTRRFWILILLLALAAGAAQAQRRNKRDRDEAQPQPAAQDPARQAPTQQPPAPPATEHDAVYRQAIKYGDYQAAAVALYYKLAQDPDNIDLKDSLATLYFTAGYYRQAVLIGREILQRRPNSVKFLEMLAISYGNLKMTEQTLETYEKLYNITGSATHLYQICVNEYLLGRVKECERDLTRIIEMPEAEAGTINITVGQGRKQDVKAKAAAWNVMGMLYRSLKETEKAESAFQSAIAADPDFVLPKNNLDELRRQSAPPPGE